MNISDVSLRSNICLYFLKAIVGNDYLVYCPGAADQYSDSVLLWKPGREARLWSARLLGGEWGADNRHGGTPVWSKYY